MKYIVAGNQLEKIGSVENLIAWVGTGAYLASGSSCAGVLRRDLCLRGSRENASQAQIALKVD